MAEDDTFLSRWSRRKAIARTAAAQADTQPATAQQVLQVARDTAQLAPLAPVRAEPVGAQVPAPASVPALATVPDPNAATPDQPAPLTMADVAALTRDSDYSAFVARDVAPDVRNAALRQLFTDPHYNVMDGLDIYIDDYGKPDPLPPGMLRQMTQTAFLGLFDHEEAETAQLAQSGSGSETDASDTPAAEPDDPTESAPDEDPDLQLQPDHAAQRSGPGADPDEDPGRQR